MTDNTVNKGGRPPKAETQRRRLQRLRERALVRAERSDIVLAAILNLQAAEKFAAAMGGAAA